MTENVAQWLKKNIHRMVALSIFLFDLNVASAADPFLDVNFRRSGFCEVLLGDCNKVSCRFLLREAIEIFDASNTPELQDLFIKTLHEIASEIKTKDPTALIGYSLPEAYRDYQEASSVFDPELQDSQILIDLRKELDQQFQVVIVAAQLEGISRRGREANAKMEQMRGEREKQRAAHEARMAQLRRENEERSARHEARRIERQQRTVEQNQASEERRAAAEKRREDFRKRMEERRRDQG